MNDAVTAVGQHVPEALVPPTTPPARRGDWLVNQLPAGMLADDFFVRFVRIFQAQAETLLAHADTLPHLADARIAPIEMVRYMARWLGTESIDDSYGEAAQRAVLGMVAKTLPWRGTRYALLRLLELYSGAPATLSEGGGVFEENRVPDDVAWVRLEVTSTGPLPTDDFVALVLDEVPAHVRTEIVVAGVRVWPATTPLTTPPGGD
ncbi:phage tail protein [Pseudactinotalea suaedae]|jgi:phage tail-like protein|uniref:phage tail protein n=1 Tax=Pseudactinotalea suaedae TaxID=1524924 RepID=UPI0012E16568|nr:phage tail protein [Pseudactinotalea suaedae]